MRTTNYQAWVETHCLYDQCIDTEFELRIDESYRGLVPLARFVAETHPAKVPYFLVFYPPTFRWSLDYTNINFPWRGSNCIVNLTRRDRTGQPSLAALAEIMPLFLRTPLLRSRDYSDHPNNSEILITPPALSRMSQKLPRNCDILKFFPEIAQFPQEQYNA